MYDADEEFRAAVDQSMPDLPMLRLGGSEEVGARLEAGLLEMVNGARAAAVASGGGQPAAGAAAAAVGSAAKTGEQQKPEGDGGSSGGD